MDKEEEKKEEQALPDEEAQQTEETAPEDGAPAEELRLGRMYTDMLTGEKADSVRLGPYGLAVFKAEKGGPEV